VDIFDAAGDCAFSLKPEWRNFSRPKSLQAPLPLPVAIPIFPQQTNIEAKVSRECLPVTFIACCVFVVSP